MRQIPSFPDLRVMHVEQNPYVRRLARQILLRVGLQRVAEASDGSEALADLKANPPDVVILDWDLPTLSGEEFLRLLRTPEISARPKIPVVVTMTLPTRAKVVGAAAVGAHEVLVKPFSPFALWSHLQVVIENPRSFVPSGTMLRPSPRVVDNSMI